MYHVPKPIEKELRLALHQSDNRVVPRGEFVRIRFLEATRESNPTCEECGEVKEFVDEAMISGVRGYYCTNDDCPRD